jgi:hypothetical protein
MKTKAIGTASSSLGGFPVTAGGMVRVLMEGRGDDVRRMYEQLRQEIPGPLVALLGDQRDPGANFFMKMILDESAAPNKKALFDKALDDAEHSLDHAMMQEEVPMSFGIAPLAEVVERVRQRMAHPEAYEPHVSPLLTLTFPPGVLPVLVLCNDNTVVGDLHVFEPTGYPRAIRNRVVVR